MAAGTPNGLKVIGGIPHVNVYDIVQDAGGLMWLATENGMCSYDGTEFRNLTVLDGLPSNRVLCLSPDAFGNIWVGTQQGVCIVRNGKVVHHIHADGPLNAYRIIHDFPLVYMLTAGKKLYTFDIMSGRMLPDGFSEVETVARHTEGGVWILTYSGLYRQKGTAAVRYTSIPVKYELLFSVLDLGGRMLWNYDRRLYTVDKNTHTMRPLHTEPALELGYNQHMYRDRSGNVWIWTVTDRGHVYKLHFDTPDSASVEMVTDDILVTRFFEDKNGDMWYATYGSGIQLNRTDTYGDRLSDASAFTNITTLYADSSRVLVGTSTGLFALKGNGLRRPDVRREYAEIVYIRRIIRSGDALYVANSSTPEPFSHTVHPQSGHMYEFGARTIEVSGDRVLVFKKGNEFFEYSMKDHEPVLRRRAEIDFPAGFTGVAKDFEYIDKYCLVATNTGLYIYDRDLRFIKHVFPGFDIFFAKAFNGSVLLGTAEGLYILYLDDRREFSVLKSVAVTPLVYSYAEISPTSVAFGTSEGVYIWSPEGAVLIDRFDHLFAGHVYALEYEPVSKILYVGANNGLFRLPLDRGILPAWRRGPKLHYMSVRANRRVEFSDMGPAEVHLDDNEGIGMTFSTYDYFDDRAPRFRYRLNNQPYQYTQSGNLVFTGLQPGDYTLNLQASANGMEWGPGLSAAFRVKPYWYQWLWLKVVFGLCILLLTVLATFLVFRSYNRRRTFYYDYNQLQLKILRTKNIPHYTTNILGILEYLVMKGDFRVTNQFLSLFNKFNTITLTESHKILRPVKDELAYVASFLELEKYRIPTGLRYTVNLSQTADLLFGVPNMIVHTLVENAVKHGILPKGTDGSVRIDVEQMGEILKITVEDDGVGRNRPKAGASAGTGMGLRMIREQLDLLKKQKVLYSMLDIVDLTDTQGAPAGTRCILFLSPRHFSPDDIF